MNIMKSDYDFLIIGSGLAGLYSALLASKHGKVGLITKQKATDSNSYNAQGGIAAVYDKEDKPIYHLEDTLVAGRGLCDTPAVDILVNEGPDRMKDLIRKGMDFDVDDRGHITLGLEGGHHRRRIFHAGGDATGKCVTSFVLSLVLKEKNIEIISNCSLLEILVKDEVCKGIRCWNDETKAEELYSGKHIILASGGTAAIYTHSTNPNTTTGDGLAIAYEAGCKVEDIEFMQFHPTALCKEGAPTFLISEAVRGEGAHLYNIAGERFMLGKHELNELAPRDIVAQMIHKEIVKEGVGHVYLSLKHLDPEKIKSRFPTIDAKCAEYGIDMCDRIPIAPAAHYTVGGINCDMDGRTNIQNLYVAGEIAYTGVMGANRLASNSLIECMVFGKRVVDSIVAKGPAAAEMGSSDPIAEFSSKYHIEPANEDLYWNIRKKVAAILTKYAFIVRCEEGLVKGLEELKALEEELKASPKFSSTEVWCKKCSDLMLTARLIIDGTRFRKESRGCLFRSDYPEESKDFEAHTIQQIGHPITQIPVEK